ncbi:hypothetical protein PCL1606_52250 [Pseudomonas chlororaphis]|uniref:Uncharacterized protein n=1 Tax=Pseudomonas chlororaphis TaxID=587753 RepID=A0A0D5Y6T6_9PSED|nr:hypothetical protein PCL1606_52250 [Pseudomonas chlororaphis]
MRTGSCTQLKNAFGRLQRPTQRTAHGNKARSKIPGRMTSGAIAAKAYRCPARTTRPRKKPSGDHERQHQINSPPI